MFVTDAALRCANHVCAEEARFAFVKNGEEHGKLVVFCNTGSFPETNCNNIRNKDFCIYSDAPQTHRPGIEPNHHPEL